MEPAKNNYHPHYQGEDNSTGELVGFLSLMEKDSDSFYEHLNKADSASSDEEEEEEDEEDDSRTFSPGTVHIRFVRFFENFLKSKLGLTCPCPMPISKDKTHGIARPVETLSPSSDTPASTPPPVSRNSSSSPSPSQTSTATTGLSDKATGCTTDSLPPNSSPAPFQASTTNPHSTDITTGCTNYSLLAKSSPSPSQTSTIITVLPDKATGCTADSLPPNRGPSPSKAYAFTTGLPTDETGCTTDSLPSPSPTSATRTVLPDEATGCTTDSLHRSPVPSRTSTTTTGSTDYANGCTTDSLQPTGSRVPFQTFTTNPDSTDKTTDCTTDSMLANSSLTPSRTSTINIDPTDETTGYTFNLLPPFNDPTPSQTSTTTTTTAATTAAATIDVETPAPQLPWTSQTSEGNGGCKEQKRVYKSKRLRGLPEEEAEYRRLRINKNEKDRMTLQSDALKKLQNVLPDCLKDARKPLTLMDALKSSSKYIDLLGICMELGGSLDGEAFHLGLKMILLSRKCRWDGNVFDRNRIIEAFQREACTGIPAGIVHLSTRPKIRPPFWQQTFPAAGAVALHPILYSRLQLSNTLNRPQVPAAVAMVTTPGSSLGLSPLICPGGIVTYLDAQKSSL